MLTDSVGRQVLIHAVCVVFNEFCSLSVSAKLVLKRWKNMKDQYIKNLKKQHWTLPGGKKMKNYIYHDQLFFLKINQEDKFEASDVESEDVSTAQKPSEKSKESAIKTRAMRSPVKRKKIDLDEDIEEHSPVKENHHLSSTKDQPFASTKDHTSSPKQNLPPQSTEEDHTATPTKEDRHLSFFNGIRPSLEQFTDDETLQFQSDVINVIQNIKKSRLLQPQPSTQRPSPSRPQHKTPCPQPQLNGEAGSERQESEQVLGKSSGSHVHPSTSPAPSDCSIPSLELDVAGS